MKNKGITLIDVLCYILIFSFLMGIIMTLYFNVQKIREEVKKHQETEQELVELSVILTRIKDLCFTNDDQLRVVYDNEVISIVGNTTNSVYFTFDNTIKEYSCNVYPYQGKIKTTNLNIIEKETYLRFYNQDKIFYCLPKEVKG